MQLKLRYQEGLRVRWLILWYALGLLFVTLGPTLLRSGLPFWELPERLLQVPVLAVGYLTTVLLLELTVRGSRQLGVWVAVVIGVVAFGVPFFLLLKTVGLAYSRIVVATSAGLGISVAMIPHLLPVRALQFSLGALAVTSLAMVLWGAAVATDGSELEAEGRGRLLRTGLHDVRITHHVGLVGTSLISGGGLDVYQDGFIVANGLAEFSRLSWDGFALRSENLAVPPLPSRDGTLADNAPESGRRFRLLDVLTDTVSSPHRVLASHAMWDYEENCLAIRVSAVAVPDHRGSSTSPGWETLYTAKPCFPLARPPLLNSGAGGRMAWTPEGDLLLTLGLFGGRRRAQQAQQLHVDYGKILILDLRGGAEVLSLGHRNPQGLLVTKSGTVWSTEHGPRGGDELNMIQRGRNYGWPLETYGTEYGSTSWPMMVRLQDDGPYQAPVYSWMPSVGVSQLVEAGPKQFPSWEGDLLIGSLSGQTLFRVRVRSGRVVYAEPISIGRRIRDLVQDPQGRVLMLTDPLLRNAESPLELISLTNADLDRTPQ